MATQSAMRMVESDQTKKWPSSKGADMFASPLSNIGVDELGFLLKRQGFHGDRQSEKMPNRSGSAPPSMEGSFAAIRNLLARNETDPEDLSRAVEKYGSEEEIRSDPAYLAYYLSNINLNPRLPPPLISRENLHLAGRFGAFDDNLRPSSLEFVGNQSRSPSRTALSTHKEEPEDEASAEASTDSWAGKLAASSIGRHKSLVDLIQEDFPRTPSPVYNQSRTSSSHTTTDELGVNDVVPSDLPGSELNSVVNISGDTRNISLVSNEDHFNASISSSNSIDGPRSSDNTSTRDTSQEHFDRVRKTQDELHARGRIAAGHHMPSQRPAQIGQGQFPMHGYPKFSSNEVQSPLQSVGIIPPPLYTTTAAYMASASPFYQNYQPSGLYSPQYSFGGYPQGGSTLMNPYMTGYLPHGTAVPLPFSASSESGYNPRLPGVSTGQNVPSFMDPYQMQYFQQHLGDAYGGLFHYDSTGSGSDSFAQKDSTTFPGNQKFQTRTNGNFGLHSPSHVGISGSSYFGVMPQFPGSPLGSPVLPSSPVSGMSHFGRRNEARHPQGMNRNAGLYSGWQGQRGVNNVDDLRRHSFLEELKSANARKLELSDIAGRIVEFSVDQHGSRFIQQKLEHCTDEEKASVFNEVLPHAPRLMTDVFGNYVIQKFLEHGSPEQKMELADQLIGQMVSLSLQMYGCRVIQKALEVIEVDQKTKLVHELDGHVMRCVRDQNGNHVIQKCIETLPPDRIGFIISAFRGQVATLSTHPYGCRVIQRILEHCSDDEQTQSIIDEIMESAFTLAHDQYGNYVTQHVLERGNPRERREIITKLTGQIVQMSQHKYASNVVEKCLEHADESERELLIDEIIGKSEEDNHLLAMMKDQFANYVVQKVLEISGDKQRELLLHRIQVHLQALRKYTYGKHIVARFEQLFGEELQGSEDGA